MSRPLTEIQNKVTLNELLQQLSGDRELHSFLDAIREMNQQYYQDDNVTYYKTRRAEIAGLLSKLRVICKANEINLTERQRVDTISPQVLADTREILVNTILTKLLANLNKELTESNEQYQVTIEKNLFRALEVYLIEAINENSPLLGQALSEVAEDVCHLVYQCALETTLSELTVASTYNFTDKEFDSIVEDLHGKFLVANADDKQGIYHKIKQLQQKYLFKRLTKCFDKERALKPQVGRIVHAGVDNGIVLTKDNRWYDATKINVGASSFIACTVPSNEVLRNRYYTLLMENADILVSLAEPDEREAGGPWYPEVVGQQRVYHDGEQQVVVELLTQEELTFDGELEYLAIRTLGISCGDSYKEVKQFHVRGWEDCKALPIEVMQVLCQLVEQEQGYSHKPIMGHCKGGVGRMGTFMLAYNYYRYHRDEANYNFISDLLDVRRYRDCVQKPQQLDVLYRFSQRLQLSHDAVSKACSSNAGAGASDSVAASSLNNLSDSDKQKAVNNLGLFCERIRICVPDIPKKTRRARQKKIIREFRKDLAAKIAASFSDYSNEEFAIFVEKATKLDTNFHRFVMTIVDAGINFAELKAYLEKNCLLGEFSFEQCLFAGRIEELSDKIIAHCTDIAESNGLEQPQTLEQALSYLPRNLLVQSAPQGNNEQGNKVNAKSLPFFAKGRASQQNNKPEAVACSSSSI